MDAFPLFMKLERRPCLVVGGGPAAARKAELLLRAGAALTVNAAALGPELAAWAAAGRLRHDPAPFSPTLVVGQRLVIVATEDEDLARRAAEAADAAGVPVNVVDRPALSSFIAGALVDRSPVLVAISTGGAAPVLARRVRRAIEEVLPSGLGCLARFALRFRGAVKAALPDGIARRRFWERFFDGPIARAVLAQDEAGANGAMLSLINRAPAARVSREPPQAGAGIVHIVGAGPGDPDLLTLRAHRLLAEADAIVHDGLVDDAVLDRARRDAERFPVAKRRGDPGIGQAAINALLTRLAREGKRVVRLKGGDPFIFGRGGEELAHVRAEGIAVEVVPGISAALGAAAATGIPLTHRDLAHSVTLVAGQAAAGVPEPDWQALARLGGTLVVYMGLANAAAIGEALIRHGMAPETPAALVARATRADERVVAGTLAGLGRLVERAAIAGPALLIIGAAVGLAELAAELPAELPGEAPPSLARAVNA